MRSPRVALAATLLIVGTGFVSASFIGGPLLKAASQAATGFDWGALILWSGAFFLVVSAGLFLIAGSD